LSSLKNGGKNVIFFFSKAAGNEAPQEAREKTQGVRQLRSQQVRRLFFDRIISRLLFFLLSLFTELLVTFD
jgi:hypothetical protein